MLSIMLFFLCILAGGNILVIEANEQQAVPLQTTVQVQGRRQRRLQQSFVNGEIPYDASVDYCHVGQYDNGENAYGACDPNLDFPDCSAIAQSSSTSSSSSQEIFKHCFHRTNRRDVFVRSSNDAGSQPIPEYYIDPRRILCVPLSAQCRTCTPGRYCLSEGRCILDPDLYDTQCTEWGPI